MDKQQFITTNTMKRAQKGLQKVEQKVEPKVCQRFTKGQTHVCQMFTKGLLTKGLPNVRLRGIKGSQYCQGSLPSD